VSRLVPYKRVALIVKAFTKLNPPLLVIEDGPDLANLRRMAGPNVRMLGYQPNTVVAEHLGRARAFVFVADDDFGIAPVEAQASGCPVIAYGKGGALETVVGLPALGATGQFFDAQAPEALKVAVSHFEARKEEFKSEVCRRNAEHFAHERFRRELEAAMNELWDRFQRGEAGVE
jgi:glycosyltransferase involved in cell wall biosynthesis